MRRHPCYQGGHPLRGTRAPSPGHQGPLRCLRSRHGDGLSVRHDNGSQYTSDAFQNELRFLGAQSSPSFVRSPKSNGCAERFIRILKEQCSWRAPSPLWSNS
ncbi:transposase family protein [Corallococcus exercitus]|uniref:Transposase family protein n=1 Tax=Corallococcus exercitus TaxID=2316736 RepID=A0A7Y4JTS8_9BACT|nr:transposase family protein [Corallococcus exercitus]